MFPITDMQYNGFFSLKYSFCQWQQKKWVKWMNHVDNAVQSDFLHMLLKSKISWGKGLQFRRFCRKLHFLCGNIPRDTLSTDLAMILFPDLRGFSCSPPSRAPSTDGVVRSRWWRPLLVRDLRGSWDDFAGVLENSGKSSGSGEALDAEKDEGVWSLWYKIWCFIIMNMIIILTNGQN